MHLYLVRHGLANWPSWKGTDNDRPLNADGSRQIEKVAKALAKHSVQLDVLLHSPLTRAYETALILASELTVTPRAHRILQPGFGFTELTHILREQAAAKHLMLVGHNPDMSVLVGQLTEELVKFKEGSVAHLTLQPTESPLTGKLVWFKTPDDW